LLAERGPGYTLAEIASRAGVGVATAYRHFPDAAAAIGSYADGLTDGLIAAFDAVPDTADPLEDVRRLCEVWVRHAAEWGPAAVYLRSPRGFLARLEEGHPFITALHERLARPLRSAMDSGALPRQDIRYTVLIWITIFDERVIVDLTHTLRWTVPAASRHLTATLLKAVGAQALA
jgi:AcrR family transcriptional regulator